MTVSFSDAAKAKKLRDFFLRHGRIYLVVDSTSDSVLVPERLKHDPALRLVMNNRMPQPIYIREDALDSDFSFGGQIFACHIPMRSIWAAYLPEGDLEHGLVWDEDVPDSIKSIVQGVRATQEDDNDGSGHGAQQDAEGRSPDPQGGKKVGHLRIIK